jgi:hypothetical protein
MTAEQLAEVDDVLAQAKDFLKQGRVERLLDQADRFQPIGVVSDEDQCLPFAAEACLRLPRGTLPRIGHGRGRFLKWKDALARVGYRIEQLDLDELPPRDRQPWIAGVLDGEHVVAAIGMQPLGEPRPILKRSEIIDAFRVVPA